jgi:CheY-like chemotaxis protein
MAEPIRVLLVDDEPDFHETIGFWLRSKGHAVVSATSGAQALERVREGAADIVFLDVMMPAMDGIETLRQIRAFDKRIPVILVTASNLTDESQYAGARALGISGLFPKGSGLPVLSQVMEVAVRRLKPSPGAAAGAGPQAAGRTRSLLARCLPFLFKPKP